MTLLRKGGHVFARTATPKSTFYTVEELKKLHRQFAHLSAASLFKSIRNAGKTEVSQDTLKTLQRIVDRCDVCQRTQRAPKRFQVSLGSEYARFNQNVYMYIMSIDSKPVLHIVDGAIHFSSA